MRALDAIIRLVASFTILALLWSHLQVSKQMTENWQYYDACMYKKIGKHRR